MNQYMFGNGQKDIKPFSEKVYESMGLLWPFRPLPPCIHLGQSANLICFPAQLAISNATSPFPQHDQKCKICPTRR